MTVEEISSASGDNEAGDEKAELGADEKTLPATEKLPNSAKGGSKSEPGSGKKKYDESLLKTLHDTFFWLWWRAGILTLLASMLGYSW